MIGVIVAFGVALVLSLGATPLFIRLLVHHHWGQFIRQDGPARHLTKRGTPTMGGVVFILAAVVGWLVGYGVGGHWPDYSSALLMLLFAGLGLIGFVDDAIKIHRERSLGLHPMAKIAGQVLVGSAFALLSLRDPDGRGQTPASTFVSVVRETNVDLAHFGMGLGVVLFLLWVNLIVASWSNTVNLTDGLDGLATGSSAFVLSGYLFISLWQFSQACDRTTNVAACYDTRDPLGLAIVAAAIVGALFGFLWWNASPAQIFMGDTGSLALGGAVAGMSILTNTEILAIVIGGLFVLEGVSDIAQVAAYKTTGRRVFLMAPIHHHFELKGWKEITIVVRFWLIAALFTIVGVSLFYGEWVTRL